MLIAFGLVALAGSAFGLEPTAVDVSHAETIRAVSATRVTLDARGRILEWGEKIDLADAAARGACTDEIPVFDSMGVTDTDGDGVFLNPICGDLCDIPGGQSTRYYFGGPFQGFAVDFDAQETAPGRNLSEAGVMAWLGLCDGSTTDTLFILFSLYEDMDTTGVGYDTDGDGIADTPFSPADLDGDGVPDSFLGGVILEYNAPPFPGAGYGIYSTAGLEPLGIPLPADGKGGVHIVMASGFVDLDGDGTPETPSPFEDARPMLWGPPSTVPGCPLTSPGTSTGTWWTLGYDVCNDMPSTSPDPYTLVYEDGFIGAVECPETLMPTFMFKGTCPSDRLCADQNSNGVVNSADFTAWIANYNANDLRADVNQDGGVSPADFTAWIAAFNQGANGPVCTP